MGGSTISIDPNNLNDVIGTDVYGSDGQRIGEVGQVFLDDATGKPEWVTVMTGMFGTKESFVPVAESQFGQEGLCIRYEKDVVKEDPRVEFEQGHLSQDEAELHRHYGLDYSEQTPTPVFPTPTSRNLGQVNTAAESRDEAGAVGAPPTQPH